jgi:hypothetical protein
MMDRATPIIFFPSTDSQLMLAPIPRSVESKYRIAEGRLGDIVTEMLEGGIIRWCFFVVRLKAVICERRSHRSR